MGTIRKLEVSRSKYDNFGNKRRLPKSSKDTLVQIVPTPRPFVKQQLVEATVTLEPATFTKPAVVKKEIFIGDFMSVVMKVQAKYPNSTNRSYQSVDSRPDWLKQEQEAEKARQEAEKAKLAEAPKE